MKSPKSLAARPGSPVLGSRRAAEIRASLAQLEVSVGDLEGPLEVC